MAVSYATNSTGTLTVQGGYWGSTPANHADDTAFELVDSQMGFFYIPSEIVCAIPNQGNFNDARGVKRSVTDPSGRISLSILIEPVNGKNGALRIMPSVEIGFGFPRLDAFIPTVKAL